MSFWSVPALVALLACASICALSYGQEKEPQFLAPIDVNVPHVGTDKSIRYDYDIVYVRARRAGDTVHKEFFTEIARPVFMQPGADLMLLHPDGTEEVLVNAGDKSAVIDPVVSFDGQWVYYCLLHDLSHGGQHEIPPGGSDLYKIHLPTRKTVRLTRQVYTPNTGAAPNWSKDFRRPDGKGGDDGKTNYMGYGVYNTGPCPLPGGRLMFTSNRNAFKPPKHPAPCLQLFVMDDVNDEADAERNVEEVGFLNIGMALHPVVLTDGRVMFSSLESQGLRTSIEWGLWVMRPDGSNWNPMLSAFRLGGGAPNAFHFQTQLSDGSIVAEEYYNQNNSGFGTYYKFPLRPDGAPGGYGMGPAYPADPRNPKLRVGREDNGRPRYTRIAFSPPGIESLTPFTHPHDGPADRSVRGDKNSAGVGKFSLPSGAPDNHLLTVYSPGPSNHQYTYNPQIDGGIYLIKSGKPVDEPAQMRLIKNDPNYNEQWPRAVVPYQRIYGIPEPKRIEPVANDGRLSAELPEGTPFGLVGTSSLYKRESFPRGSVPKGSVTATWLGGKDDRNPRGGFRGLETFNSPDESTGNWMNQGADAGLYDNSEIHAVRILAMEPTTDRNRGPKGGKQFYNHANERLRILGEIPVRKFSGRSGTAEPTDPDGNPDTSFLAKIPADTAFTFQTLDKHGMVLNMAQTWHQVRPGEVRNNCGGCHAHSQEPTPFEKTATAADGYRVFDLTRSIPLLTDAKHDESKSKWDAKGETGLRYAPAAVKNVEFHRDVEPIFARSCNACHTGKWEKEMGMLVLDDTSKVRVENGPDVPNNYARLAADNRSKSKFGHPPVMHEKRWAFPNASRYVRMFQSRRSLLVWKILGERTDGFSNDDFPTETTPGDPETLAWKGQKLDGTRDNCHKADLDYDGRVMPPPEAMAGTYKAPDGSTIKVERLSDEDRRTIIRWIDLGCPIDLDYDPAHPDTTGYGWMLDDNRPTLAVTWPKAGRNERLTRVVVGAYDYYTGLDEKSLSVKADFVIDGVPAGQELAGKLKPGSRGVWEWKLDRPVDALERGTITVSIKDRQGNVSRIERALSVAPATAAR